MIPRFEPTASLAEIVSFLVGCLRRRHTCGLDVRKFEELFAAYQGCEHAVFVPSGRVALWLILKGLNYPAGSDIILPAFTFYAIPAMVKFLGLTPVFADVEPGTYTLNPDSVRSVMTADTRAVVPTHLFGRTCDVEGLEALCKPRGIDIIEDCAQSFGARVGEGKAGSVGCASYFTFGITKNFTTFSGGMLVCHDGNVRDRFMGLMPGFTHAAGSHLLKQGITALAMRLASQRLLFNLSSAILLRLSASDGPDVIHRAFDEKAQLIDDGVMARLKWRPVDLQARVGMRQLPTLDAKNAARRRNGAELLNLLRESGCRGLPASADPDGDHIYMSFAIMRQDHYRFAAALRRHGVDTAPGYMTDCSSVGDFGGRPGLCPVAEQVGREIIHLPLYPGLAGADLKRIADAVVRVDEQLGCMVAAGG